MIIHGAVDSSLFLNPWFPFLNLSKSGSNQERETTQSGMTLYKASGSTCLPSLEPSLIH